ncbi:MAG: hypothetical protein M3362_18205, partial [Acidobacteriota bacterium]|nr:hypothetical protein [Acidobacteriota bacterium]
MSAIYWRELRYLLKSARLPLAACLFLLGMTVNGLVMSGAYQDLQRMHKEVEARADERLRESASRVELLATNFNEIFGSSNHAQALT